MIVQNNISCWNDEIIFKEEREEDALIHQVGGHKGKYSLIYIENMCLKPYFPLERGKIELEFYEGTRDRNTKQYYLSHHKLIPHYFGLVEKETRFGINNFIVLENISYGFKHPVILDVKMGTQTWDPESTDKKLLRHLEKDKATTTQMLGFKLCGLRRFDIRTKTYFNYPKTYGWNCTSDEVCDALSEYFFDGEEYRVDVIDSFLYKLNQILAFFSTPSFMFYTSSLLFVYDGEKSLSFHVPDVRMIDFAHTWEENDHCDEGYIKGLHSLIECLNRIKQLYSNNKNISQYL